MMRVGLYRPVHVKTLRSQKLRMLLTHRKLLQSKAIAIRDFKHPDRIVVGSDEPRARGDVGALSPALSQSLADHVHRPAHRRADQMRRQRLPRHQDHLHQRDRRSGGKSRRRRTRGCARHRARQSHRLEIPARRAGPGFGGSCFPKDAVALLKTGLDHDVPLRIVEAVVAVTRLDGGGRVQVLLQFLGSEVPVSVSRDALMPARAA
jgi:hypothetical protein